MKNLEDLKKTPFTREVIPDPSGGFIGSIKELPGCLTQGDTLEETWNNLQEAMELWLEAAVKKQIAIPEPDIERTFNGKILVRLPKSLHHKLSSRAEMEGTSLNQYVVSVLAENIGFCHSHYYDFSNTVIKTHWMSQDSATFGFSLAAETMVEPLWNPLIEKERRRTA